VSGVWSEKAVAEARKYSRNIHVAATSKNSAAPHYTRVPDWATWTLRPEARYVFYCPNETIDGVEFDTVPDTHVRAFTEMPTLAYALVCVCAHTCAYARIVCACVLVPMRG
jgi:phosphoserine aminotransferase